MYINLIFIIVVKPVRWSGFKLEAINVQKNNGLKLAYRVWLWPGPFWPYGPYRTGFYVPRLFHSGHKNAPTEGRRMSVAKMSHRGWTSVRERAQPNILVSDDGSHGVLNFILCAVVLLVFCDSLCIYIYYFTNTRCSSRLWDNFSMYKYNFSKDRAGHFSIHN